MKNAPYDSTANLEADFAREVELLGKDHSDCTLIKAYRAWIDGSGPAVDDPELLLHQDGLSRGRSGFSMLPMAVREFYVAQIGFTVPVAGLGEVMRPYGPIIEVGAGRGYLSQILRHGGIDAIATDLSPEVMNSQLNRPRIKASAATVGPVVCPVEQMDAVDAVHAFPGRTVLCAWPTLGDDWITHAAKAMIKGQYLAVVGESNGGCTADDSFFELLAEKFALVARPNDPPAIWRFPGIHDDLDIYVKR